MGACASAPSASGEGDGSMRPGTLVQHGRLRVVKQLGVGSWASVYLVERVRDGQRYALKRTAITELSEAEKWIAVNEVRLLASLAHPNVVEYKHCFLEGGCLNVVMEVVPHGELAAVIEQHRREERCIREEEIWGYLLQIVLGLQHLHASGIVHRDLKPANILLGHGVLKLADLGVAGLLHMGSSKLQIGTPQYMAPEMHAKRSYGHAADVWSLGCLLFELATLRPLFGDRDEEAVARKVLGLALPPALPGRYSPELQVMVNRMLQQDPAARPSLEEVLAAPRLRARLDHLPATLSRELSLGTLSLACMEGVPILPAIDVPADLSQLHGRLPPGRGSFDNAEEAADMAARMGLPVVARPTARRAADKPAGGGGDGAPPLPRVASPVTVLGSCSPAASADTPGGAGTASSTMSAVDEAVAAALAAEQTQRAPPLAAAAAPRDDFQI